MIVYRVSIKRIHRCPDNFNFQLCAKFAKIMSRHTHSMVNLLLIQSIKHNAHFILIKLFFMTFSYILYSVGLPRTHHISNFILHFRKHNIKEKCWHNK